MLDAMGENWWHRAAHEMTPAFMAALNESKKESDILKFRQQIAKNLDPLNPFAGFDLGELIINCHREDDSSPQCFEHYLQEYVTNAAQEYAALNTTTIADEAMKLHNSTLMPHPIE